MTPTREDFIEELREALEYAEKADDAGSIDFLMMAFQRWVSEWDKIGTEEGGI